MKKYEVDTIKNLIEQLNCIVAGNKDVYLRNIKLDIDLQINIPTREYSLSILDYRK